MNSPRNKSGTIALIILAAGGSRRMGQPKQLLPIGGEPLIKHVVREGLRSKCFPVIAVLGDKYARIIPEIENLPVYIARNRNWSRGISSSIKCGLDTLQVVYPKAPAVILAVADQVEVSSGVFNGIVDVFRSSSAQIIASRYQGTKGTPALFTKKYFSDLRSLRGDKGARKLIESKADRIVQCVDFDQGEIDLDTPEDYFRFSQM